ncbi:MAG: hypothetical protein L0Y56_08690, partial [Nitrospira sp.]|nr:hypothetical protein [Nitrospira sp.]
MRYPLLPGSRVEPRSMAWQLAPNPGLDYVEQNGTPRADWVVIDLETVLAPTLGVKEEIGEVAPGSPATDGAIEELERLDERTGQIGEE